MSKNISYENFERIAKEKNITPYRIAKETGVATSTLTSWKKGSYVPKVDKLIKIANFLGVPLNELIKEDD